MFRPIANVSYLIMSIHEFFRRRHCPKYGHFRAKFFLVGNFAASAAATFDATAAAAIAFAAATFDNVISVAFRRGRRNFLSHNIFFRRRRRRLRHIFFLSQKSLVVRRKPLGVRRKPLGVRRKPLGVRRKPLGVRRRVPGGYFVGRRIGRLWSTPSRAADEADNRAISQSYLETRTILSVDKPELPRDKDNIIGR